MRTYTAEQIVDEIRKRVSYECSQNDLAKELGISAAFLSGILRGDEKLSDRLALSAGYERLPVRYRKVQKVGE